MVHNGKDGLECFKEHRHDLIVTDIQMPVMDGLEMSKKIKEIEPDASIIIFSAFGNAENLKSALDIGVSDYLLKPLTSNIFRNSFKKVLTNLYNKHLLEKKHQELIEAKEKALQASRTKSEFLANMSHEIRTPLNAINGFVEIILNEFEDEKLLEYVSIIQNSSKNLLEIINDILDFSKIESGKLDINKESFYIKDNIKKTVELFGSIASQKDINLTLNINEFVPEIFYSDPLRVNQIISNLLSNAIKFTNDKGDVELNISLSQQKDKIYFCVKDNGIGISQEYQANIFKQFSQEDLSTTKHYGGTGLGLAISYKLVQMLGGDISVQSIKGEGSEFFFELPIMDIPNEKIQHKSTKQEHQDERLSFEGKKVLIVEDNHVNQMFMKISLKKKGFTFDVASDGCEAIELFKQNSYDAILMDENMPNMNGIEAAKHIIKIEEENNMVHTPIIALTASALKGDREKFIHVGMDEYLTKPLDLKKLCLVLKEFIKN
jgi:signal transduction histidine kinase